MASSKIMPLYAQIAGLIEREIESNNLPPGHKIQSIRQICEQFKVADVTAKKALKVLSQRNIIRTVNGSGAFVMDRSGRTSAPLPRQTTVGFIKSDTRSAPIFVMEIEMIQQELSRMGYPTMYSVAGSDDEMPRLLQKIEHEVTCLLLFPHHGIEPDKTPYISVLRRLSVPVLIIESRTDKGSYVTTDVERASQMMTEYLYELGHRRICLASSHRRKHVGFKKALQRYNDPSVQHWILGERGKSDDDAHFLGQQILELNPRPTAVVAGNENAAAVLVNHFLGAGLRVPEDISIISPGDYLQRDSISPIPLTVVRHPINDVAGEVAQWVGRQVNGQGSRRRLRREISGALIVRETTAPPGMSADPQMQVETA